MTSRFRAGRAWMADHPALMDGVLAVAMLVLATLDFWHYDAATEADSRRADAFGYLLTLVIVAPVAWRRSRPATALGIATAGIACYWFFDYVDGGASLALLVLLYSVAAYTPRQEALRSVLLSAAAVGTVLLIGLLPRSGADVSIWDAVGSTVIYGAAFLVGDTLRNRRAYRDELERRVAESALREQAEANRAVSEERARIARDLHDVVAHRMSEVVLQAAGARRTLDDDPDTAARALGDIEQAGRSALEELRTILGVLRAEDDGGPSLGPQPGLDDLPELIAGFRATGLDVVTNWPDPLPTLAPGLDLTLHRITQEALTNVLKHAGPTTVHCTLDVEDDDEILLEVRDQGPRSDDGARPPSPVGSTQGLLGVRERAAAFGGTVEAGPDDQGGWRLTVRVPLRATVATGRPSH